MKNLQPLLTITGPSGSGKSTLENNLAKYGYKKAVSHTSRSPREKEKDGEAYYFVSEDEIINKYLKNELAEFIIYNNNYYGVANTELLNSDILVVEPSGLTSIKKYLDNKRKVISLYLDIDEETVTKRLKKRGDSEEEIQRRLKSDKEKFFYEKELYDIVINTKYVSKEELVDIVLCILLKYKR